MLRCCVKQGLASGLASCLGFALAGWRSFFQNLADAMERVLCEQTLLVEAREDRVAKATKQLNRKTDRVAKATKKLYR